MGEASRIERILQEFEEHLAVDRPEAVANARVAIEHEINGAWRAADRERAALPKRIRVRRLMEYDYQDAETMVQDMANWHVQSSVSYDRMQIRSTVLPVTIWTPGEEPVDGP